MKNSLESRLGLFFALVVVAGFVLLELTGGFDLLRAGRPVRARFQTVQDLKVGDPVKLGGVTIGKVARIELAGNQVEVTLRVQESADLRTDTRAAIRFTGLLGQNFVSLEFGSPDAPKLSADALLQTREQADLNSILAKLEGVADGVQNMTRSFSGEEFSKLLGPVTELVKDNTPRITDLLENMRQVSAQVAKGQGTVGRLIHEEDFYRSALGAVTNVNGLAGDAKGMITDASGLIGDARKVVTGVNQGQGSIGRLLQDDTLARELTTAGTNLREILQKINQGQGSVGKLVNDESFLKNIKMTLQKVDKATEGLEDTGPLNVLGTAIGTFF